MTSGWMMNNFIQIDKSGIYIVRRGRMRFYDHKRYSFGWSRGVRVERCLAYMGIDPLRLSAPPCDRYYLKIMKVRADKSAEVSEHD